MRNGMRFIFWPIFVATVAVYAAMAVWTMPTISAEAGGLAPFDMRATGFTLEYARAFLSALSPAGRDLYLGAQQMLDLFFPALLAATLVLAITALTARGWLRWLLILITLAGMVFDYVENFSVARMLEHGADGVTQALVSRASLSTMLKSLFDGLALLGTLALVGVWLARRRARR